MMRATPLLGHTGLRQHAAGIIRMPALFYRTVRSPKRSNDMDLRKTSLIAAALCLGSTAAVAQVKVTNGMLTDNKGMTLYVFDKDAGGKSACSGGCAAIWSPVM